MRSSCSPPLLLLLLSLLPPPAASAACPALPPGTDSQTKAFLAPIVFQGAFSSLARRGHAVAATFTVERALKGPLPDDSRVVVEFARRERPARCRGAPLPEQGLQEQRRYIVFAARRRGRLIAVAVPEDSSKKKFVEKVLCNQCAKAPSVRKMREKRVDLNSKLRLKCKISGNPPPRITWLKDGIKVKANNRIKLRSKRKTFYLVINRAEVDDSGSYECLASNVLGNATASCTVHIQTVSTTDQTLWPFIKKSCPKENFCLNGATCFFLESVREYVCECAEGFRGQRCESKSPPTLSNNF